MHKLWLTSMVIAHPACSCFVGELVFIYFNTNKAQVTGFYKAVLQIFVELVELENVPKWPHKSPHTEKKARYIAIFPRACCANRSYSIHCVRR